MKQLARLSVRLFVDSGDINVIRRFAAEPWVRGFTTNPSLLLAAHVANYKSFAVDVLHAANGRPISLATLSDDLNAMTDEALAIASWGSNIYVKIPIVNSQRISTNNVIGALCAQGVRVNVTAITTVKQVESLVPCLSNKVPSFVSVLAGRIADTGRDPEPVLVRMVHELQALPSTELLWASAREVLNVFQADKTGCDVITLPTNILEKLSLLDKNLDDCSWEAATALMSDAQAAGLTL